MDLLARGRLRRRDLEAHARHLVAVRCLGTQVLAALVMWGGHSLPAAGLPAGWSRWKAFRSLAW